MSKALLLDEPCLVIQPALVRALGHLADAAVLQQIHYWTQRSTNQHNGERWVYKTYAEWSDEIGISEKQARDAIARLEEHGLVLSCQPEAYKRRKWYRIDYENSILTGEPSALWVTSIRPIGQMEVTHRADGTDLLGRSITETTTEITTEITTKSPTLSSTDVERFDPVDKERLLECSRLADVLADLIEQNGTRRPKVSKKWISTIDRMIRIDHRTSEQIERAILWATSDPFWSTNILSPDALRRHFDRMSLQARRNTNAKTPRGLTGVREFLDTLTD